MGDGQKAKGVAVEGEDSATRVVYDFSRHEWGCRPGRGFVGGVKRVLMWIIVGGLVLLMGSMAFLTIFWFVNPSTEEVAAAGPADAVVIFAGRTERLETAIDLMEAGAAPNLVIPNGSDIEGADSLCDDADFNVFCPETDEETTAGEARTIGRLAADMGWSSLIAVTSEYHIHRATYLLDRCYSGSIEAVAPPRDYDLDELTGEVGHEWAGYLAAVVLRPAC